MQKREAYVERGIRSSRGGVRCRRWQASLLRDLSLSLLSFPNLPCLPPSLPYLRLIPSKARSLVIPPTPPFLFPPSSFLSIAAAPFYIPMTTAQMHSGRPYEEVYVKTWVDISVAPSGEGTGNGNDRFSLSLFLCFCFSLSFSFAREASTGLLQGRRKILVVARVDGTALLRSSDSSCGSDFWGS